MTDEHVTTAQETAIYDALTAGDHDAIDTMRADAYAADQTPPEDAPGEWLSPREQFDTDYSHGWTHYQADHEAPAPARVVATAVHVETENTDAPEVTS